MGLEKLCKQWNCSQIHCWYYSCAGVSMLNSFRKCYMMLNILNNGPVMNVGPVYLELTGCWLRRLRLTATQCTPTPSWNINGNSDVEFLLDLTNLKPRLWSPARSSQCCVHTAPATADLRVSWFWCSWHDDIMTDMMTSWLSCSLIPGQETPGPTAACHPSQRRCRECRNDSASCDVCGHSEDYWSNC